MQAIYLHGLKREAINTNKPADKFKHILAMLNTDEQTLVTNTTEVFWNRDEKADDIVAGTLELVNDNDVLLIGHSTGGHLMVMVYEELKKMNVQARLVLLNPLVDTNIDIIPQQLKETLTADFSKVEDAILIVTMDDEVLDYRLAVKALSNKTKFLLVPRGGHSMDLENDEIVKEVLTNYVLKYS